MKTIDEAKEMLCGFKLKALLRTIGAQYQNAITGKTDFLHFACEADPFERNIEVGALQ